MHLLAWLDALGAADSSADSSADLADASAAASRRAALARLGRGALATVPAGLTALAATAGPRPRITSVVTDALNLTLRVAHAQRSLLTGALATGGTPLPGPAEGARLQAVLDHTNDLIARVETSVRLSGDVIVTPPATYDFTGNRGMGGAGPLNPSGSYDDVLVLAQVFADTLSRALLSSFGVLTGNTVFAELAGQLLGTTSRLAADVRLLRQARNPAVQPWVVGAESPATLPALLVEQVPAYDGEDRTVICNILDLASTGVVLPNGTSTIVLDPIPPRAVITAAFDQPLPLTQTETLPFASLNRLLALFNA